MLLDDITVTKSCIENDWLKAREDLEWEPKMLAGVGTYHSDAITFSRNVVVVEEHWTSSTIWGF